MRIALVSVSRVLNSRVLWPLAGALALATTAASGQTFTGLGLLPSGTESKSRGVSDDGGVVVGNALIPPDNSTPTTGYRTFRWTAAGGMESLGTLGGGPYWFSGCRDVSTDGSVVVGGTSTSNGERAYRWTAGTGMISLGTLPQHTSSNAHGVSSNGLVVVGKSTHPSKGDRAFRWSGGVMTDLGTLPGGKSAESWAVSASGAVVAGLSGSRNGDRAFRWTSAGMQDLGPAVSRNTSKGDVSPDGLVVVGATGSAGGPVSGDRAFRWTAGTGMQSLGTLQVGWGSWATGVNGDGSMIVGSSGSESHPSNARHAFLWTAGTGMVDLNTYLPTLGIDLNGWTLVEAHAIGADGRTIAGYGLDEVGLSEAWVVRLP